MFECRGGQAATVFRQITSGWAFTLSLKYHFHWAVISIAQDSFKQQPVLNLGKSWNIENLRLKALCNLIDCNANDF